ncbi:MAG: succinate dehydrogenase subunit C [Candidatus Electronema aureum]|uniref:Succinate dehydrogenase subunit C n=1 Tax=Candidatus Electronema aureum TaxID=2005002 RepID=A0A521G3C4_9BACT|nr:MAG: succinate dehydrogenase subunit C [Candidatus Electronema aureum]
MSHVFRVFASSLGKKYIMALTGLLLGGFLLVHAAGNSLIFQGREAFTAYAEHLHSFRLILPTAGLLLLAIFLLHIVTGISLFLSNRKAQGHRYAVSKSATETQAWIARTMPATGTTVLAFLLLHLGTVHFADQAVPLADRISQTLTDPLLAVLYAVGIAALALHISHGFWSLTQTFGINHPRYNGLIKICTYLVVILVSSLFIGIMFSFRR